MDPITTFRGKSVALNIPNIDTDQVTPANYTKVTDKQGLGKILFAHWRYKNAQFDPNPDFPLNRPGAEGATILVAGDNFGCGSSREHAPWALVGYGFRAIVSTSFADIFRNNALKNGLIPVVVDVAAHAEALEAAEKHLEIAVDLPNQKVTLPSGRTATFPIDPFQKRCLVQGVDEMGYLLAHQEEIGAFERRRA
ncbi:MAG TPA: 3-isopropylmalate dehydratase small subunit [Planctomycetota bacterium]|nr:3-isopropylmalate dehydratase small subunit [Planctomycetota bacterium]